MRYQVLNIPHRHLGQVECTGDVCRIPPRQPAPGYVAPARSITRKEAASAAGVLQTVIENNPTCFEGEDLTVAYALQQKLADYGGSSDAMYKIMVILELSEEEARVLGRAETCSQIRTAVRLPDPNTQPSVQPTTSRGSSPGAPSLPAGPSAFPIVPIAVGAGALGLIALIVAAVK